MLRLFNLVLSSGCSPDLWSQGLITPIHKSGDKLDPNNFRGICVSSNLGKLFSSILNNRIVNFLNEHNVLSPSQIGFLPNYRTTDHIHTLINKHVKQTEKYLHILSISKKHLILFGMMDYITNFYKVV